MHALKKKARAWLRAFDRRVGKGRLFLRCNGVAGPRYREILRLSENPILIGGCGRSGTTLLLSLLSAHPNIYGIEKTGAFCISAYSDEPDPGPDFKVERIYCHLAGSEVETERYSRWCEKTPKNVLFARQILDYFGEGARFINIVRDGRDVVTSIHPSDPESPWVSPERWVRDVSAGTELEEAPRALTVRYEDLVRSPLEVLRRICRFVGEPFAEEAFRAYPESAQIQSSRNWSSGARAISDSSIGRWREDSRAPAVERLLSIEEARALLRYYGYVRACPAGGNDTSLDGHRVPS